MVISSRREDGAGLAPRVRRYHDGLDPAPSGAVDERTWADLDMDAVFVTLDHTVSQPGRQYLYHLVRTPVRERAPLETLERAVACLEPGSPLAIRVRAALESLRDARAASLTFLFLQALPSRSRVWLLFPLLTATAIACLLLFPLWPRLLLLLPVVCIANICVQLYFKPRLEAVIPALHEIPAFLRAARELGTITEPALAPQAAALRKSAAALGTLRRMSGWVSWEPGQANDLVAIAYTYVNLLFLLDMNAFAFGLAALRAGREDFRAVFEAMGFIDAAMSIARWRDRLPRWTTPTFADSGTPIEATELVHPLLGAPVANSVKLDTPGTLITGSNMSGKTTFVRTLGVNALLAQTIHTVCGAAWHAPFVEVRASIGGGDSLLEGKSTYLAEAESVRELVRAQGSECPHLFLLDELFRGTNTPERLAAGTAVLRYLARGTDQVVVATHDLELLDRLNGTFRPYHFRETIVEGALSFDYRIRPGLSSTRNAIAVLDLLGYPQEIVTDALSQLPQDAGPQALVTSLETLFGGHPP